MGNRALLGTTLPLDDEPNELKDLFRITDVVLASLDATEDVEANVAYPTPTRAVPVLCWWTALEWRLRC